MVENRQALLDCNVDSCVVHEEYKWFVPWVMSTYKDGHHDLENKVYAAYEKKVDAFFEQSSYAELLASLIDRITNSKQDRIIFSSEFFSEANSKRLHHRLQILRDLQVALKDQIDLCILYICRGQGALIESVYLQWFRPYHKVSFDAFKKLCFPLLDHENASEGKRPHFNINYLDQKRAIADMFVSPFELKMLSYEKICRNNGLLYAFEHACDLPDGILASKQQEISRKNISLGPLAVDILRYSDSISEQDKKKLDRLFRNFGCFHERKEPHRLLTPSERDKIYRYFYNSNQEVFALSDDEMRKLYNPEEESETFYSVKSYDKIAKLLLALQKAKESETWRKKSLVTRVFYKLKHTLSYMVLK